MNFIFILLFKQTLEAS